MGFSVNNRGIENVHVTFRGIKSTTTITTYILAFNPKTDKQKKSNSVWGEKDG
jgi:hypothetical protein